MMKITSIMTDLFEDSEYTKPKKALELLDMKLLR